MHQFEDTYLPRNIKLCPTEKEVAEDFGPFLFHKDEIGRILGGKDHPEVGSGPGMKMERRRSKRMHVAIPLELTLYPQGGKPLTTLAISTNISEGGIFVEFLDLDSLQLVEELSPVEGLRAEIQIHPNGNFPEEYHLEGLILRKEARKRGMGLAIEFESEKS
jgi:hypothetical protein